MKNVFAVVALFLAVGPHTALACSCLAVEPPATKWLKRVASSSSYIFVGTVQQPPTSLLAGTPVSLRITKHLKGQFSGTPVLDDCPSFKLAAGDERVFFVGSTGAINGCSDYTYYLTNFGVLRELSRILSPGT